MLCYLFRAMIFEFTKQAMFKLTYVLLFVSFMIPAMVQSVSPHNLTWTEYHPLHHHQEYLHYLQKEFPNIVQVAWNVKLELIDDD